MIRRPIAKKLFQGVKLKWAQKRCLYYGQYPDPEAKKKKIKHHASQPIKPQVKNDNTKERSKDKEISFLNTPLKYLKNIFFGETQGISLEGDTEIPKNKTHETKLSEDNLNMLKRVYNVGTIEKIEEKLSKNQQPPKKLKRKGNQLLTKSDDNTDRKAQLQDNMLTVKSRLTNSVQDQKKKHMAKDNQGVQNNSVSDTKVLAAEEQEKIPKLNTKQQPQTEIKNTTSMVHYLEPHIQTASEQQNLRQQKEISFAEQQLLNKGHNVKQPSQDQFPNTGYVYQYQSEPKPHQQQQIQTASMYQQYPYATYVNQPSEYQQYLDTENSNQLPPPQHQQQKTNTDVSELKYPNAAYNVKQPYQYQQKLNIEYYKTQLQRLQNQQLQTKTDVSEQKYPNATFYNQPSQKQQYLRTRYNYDNHSSPSQNQQQETKTDLLMKQHQNSAYNVNEQYSNAAYQVSQPSQDQKYKNSEYYSNQSPSQTWLWDYQMPLSQEAKIQPSSSNQKFQIPNYSATKTDQQLTQTSLTEQRHRNASNYYQPSQQHLSQKQIQKAIPDLKYQNAYYINPTQQQMTFPGQQYLTSGHGYNLPLQQNLQQQSIQIANPNQQYQNPYYFNQLIPQQPQIQTSFPFGYQQYQNIPLYANQLYQNQQNLVQNPLQLPKWPTPTQTDNMVEYRGDFVNNLYQRGIKGEQRYEEGTKTTEVTSTNQEDRLFVLANLLDQLKKLQGFKKHK